MLLQQDFCLAMSMFTQQLIRHLNLNKDYYFDLNGDGQAEKIKYTTSGLIKMIMTSLIV